MSSAKPPPPTGPQPPRARKPGDPLGPTEGKAAKPTAPEPTAETAAATSESAAARGKAAADAQAGEGSATGKGAQASARQPSQEATPSGAGARPGTTDAGSTEAAASMGKQPGARKATRTTQSATTAEAEEAAENSGQGFRSRFADAWESAKEAAKEAPSSPEGGGGGGGGGGGFAKFLLGVLGLGGAGVAYVGYLYSTDANTVRQLEESKSPLLSVFSTLGVSPAVKGPEFPVNRTNLLHRVHSKLAAASGGEVDPRDAADAIAQLCPEVDADEVEAVLRRRSRSASATSVSAFIATGKDALSSIEDAYLFTRSRKSFNIMPISKEMYSLLDSLYETFDGADGNAVSLSGVKEFSAKLDLGGDETAARLAEEVELPQTDSSGMGREDFVNLIALLLESVPEARRVEKLQQQLKLYRIHQRERQRAVERDSELAQQDEQRAAEYPFAQPAPQPPPQVAPALDADATSHPQAQEAPGVAAAAAEGGAGLQGLPFFQTFGAQRAPAAGVATTLDLLATPELEDSVAGAVALRGRLATLRENEKAFLDGLDGGAASEDADKQRAAAFRDAKLRVKQRIKQVEKEAKQAAPANS